MKQVRPGLKPLRFELTWTIHFSSFSSVPEKLSTKEHSYLEPSAFKNLSVPHADGLTSGAGAALADSATGTSPPNTAINPAQAAIQYRLMGPSPDERPGCALA
jgi:hypothetical protein